MIPNTRHIARSIGLQMLYRLDGEKPELSTPQATIAWITQHFDHFTVPNEQRAFIAELVSATWNARVELDQQIDSVSYAWRTQRMAMIDRNLLRMSCQELRQFPDTPFQVVVNEAIELAKEFGTQDTPSFVNAILDTYRKTYVTPTTA
jgi:N utilization substance protein B